MTKPVVLCILDGWGLSETQAGNAPALRRPARPMRACRRVRRRARAGRGASHRAFWGLAQSTFTMRAHILRVSKTPYIYLSPPNPQTHFIPENP